MKVFELKTENSGKKVIIHEKKFIMYETGDNMIVERSKMICRVVRWKSAITYKSTYE
jgi:hypothetical protein